MALGFIKLYGTDLLLVRPLTFHYNPTNVMKEYGHSEQKAKTQGTSSIKYEYKYTEPIKIKIDLFFNDWGHNGILYDIDDLPNSSSVFFLDRKFGNYDKVKSKSVFGRKDTDSCLKILRSWLSPVSGTAPPILSLHIQQKPSIVILKQIEINHLAYHPISKQTVRAIVKCVFIEAKKSGILGRINSDGGRSFVDVYKLFNPNKVLPLKSPESAFKDNGGSYDGVPLIR